jgi:molybdopterin converting factor small subunit
MKENIHIRLFATLNKFLPDEADAYAITPGTTVERLIKHLGIPAQKAKLIFVNSQKADLDTVLKGGDRLGIFPPVGGG